MSYAKEPLDAQRSLERLQRLCVRQEKCLSDVRRKLSLWGVGKEDAAKVEQLLLAAKFVDEARYAAAFVREKSRLSRWGALKIRAALQAKRLPAAVVAEALAQLDGEQAAQNLLADLQRKAKTIRATSPQELRAKLIRFGVSRGYGYEQVVRTATLAMEMGQP
ncbi:MAG: RecX family transcriptional regulator [Prevotellaceae bacterium]|jgi:regulatory protein|nr:RecX family transcriptional regulator [Prevotellaceae bacterium]